MVIVLSAAALFVYLRQRADLTDTIDGGLRTRSNDVAALIGGSDGDLEEVRGSRLTSSEGSFVQVLAPDGRRLDRTGGASGAALRPEEALRASRRIAMFEHSVEGVEGKMRMLARPVATRGRIFVVVAGESLADRDDTLKGLMTSFLIGGPVGVLFASGLGYLLATAGFAPVEAMRQRAKEISLSAKEERLPLPSARDEIRRLGETLNEMLARLEGSFERERRFVADASHELRTPLAVLKTELEAALRVAAGDEKLREPLAAALEETDHLAQLAEDLLLIARAAEGRLPVLPESMEVREFLDRTRERFADRAREQGREIQVEAAAELRASIDPLRGRQAVGNLVDNALRHGSGDVQLRARAVDGVVEIDVGDEGFGFPAELVPYAFERFTRSSKARARDGTGLGLAIARVIAEAHGGTAAIVEQPEGATVRLSFPTA